MFYWLGYLFCMCISGVVNGQAQAEERDMQPITVTVFVHGTRLFPKFYLQELFYSPAGLVRVADLEPASHMHTIAQSLSADNSRRFSYDHFYAFGWSGLLSFAARKKAARALYDEIGALMQAYQREYGVLPEIRIITHSHGGNVVLNMCHIAEQEGSALCIKDLILLACPVQQMTKDYIKSSNIGMVYSFSSRGDVLQVIDPQKLYRNGKPAPLFSKRIFEVHDRLVQAQVALHERWLFHIEFFLSPFLSKLPMLLDALDAWKKSDEGAAQHNAGTIPVASIEDECVKISFVPGQKSR